MKKRTMLALAATAAAALACSRNGQNPKLDQTVMARLSQEPSLAATDLHVRSDGGHVYLSGRVRTTDQRKIAAEVADDVRGVDRVTNDIQVDVAAPPPASNVMPPSNPAPDAAPPEDMPPSQNPTGEPPPTSDSPENSQ